MKKTSTTIENLEGWMQPVYKFFSKNISSLVYSVRDREYTFNNLGLEPRVSFMA